MDTMIGRFIAQYEEAAGGCLLDADTAEALAKEFKNMENRIVQLETVLQELIDQCHDCEKQLTEELHKTEFCGESAPLTNARTTLAQGSTK